VARLVPLLALHAGRTSRPVDWFRAVRTFAAGDSADLCKWQRLRPLRAVCPETSANKPIHDPPRLSGCSLCQVNGTHLLIYGGRCSTSGETRGGSYLVQVQQLPPGMVRWSRVCCMAQPAARCYHASVMLPGHGEQPGSTMLMFGGAGAGDVLHDDAWGLEVRLEGSDQAQGSQLRGCSFARWEQVPQPAGRPRPSPRSSHVLAAWSRSGAAVLHGGLGTAGVMSDVWRLWPDGEWEAVPTSGAAVARAHHCGAIHGDHLLVHSGQDETFLTVHMVCSLNLQNSVWHEVVYPNGPSSRIDAAAASLEGIGVLMFGGVDTAFAFESTDFWLLKGAAGVSGDAFRVALATAAGPRPHACGSLCVAGLRAYSFGGFDGHGDLDDLWCLPLVS